MAAEQSQKYYFTFVHEDGKGLLDFFRKPIAASVDEVFRLEEVNKALKNAAGGGSKGKTILRIS